MQDARRLIASSVKCVNGNQSLASLAETLSECQFFKVRADQTTSVLFISKVACSGENYNRKRQ